MTFVLYFEREKDYYEVLASLHKSGINPEHRITPYLIKCDKDIGNIDVTSAIILTHPIEPSILEKMIDNVKVVAQGMVMPQKESPSSLKGEPWDRFGKGP